MRGLDPVARQALFQASEDFVTAEPWTRLFLGNCFELEHNRRRYFAYCLGAGGGCPPTLNIHMSFREYTDAREAAKERRLAEGTFLRTTFGESPVECTADRNALIAFPQLEKRPMDYMKLAVVPGQHPQPLAFSVEDLELLTVALRVAVECSTGLELAMGRAKPTVDKSYLDDYSPATGLAGGATLWIYPAAALKWRCHNRECNNATNAKCSGCKAVCFCSKECQKKEWKAGHREECPRFRGLMEQDAAVPRAATGGAGFFAAMPWSVMTCAENGVNFEGFLRQEGLLKDEATSWWDAEFASCHLKDAKPIPCDAPIMDMAKGLALPADQLPSKALASDGPVLTSFVMTGVSCIRDEAKHIL